MQAGGAHLLRFIFYLWRRNKLYRLALKEHLSGKEIRLVQSERAQRKVNCQTRGRGCRDQTPDNSWVLEPRWCRTMVKKKSRCKAEIGRSQPRGLVKLDGSNARVASRRMRCDAFSGELMGGAVVAARQRMEMGGEKLDARAARERSRRRREAAAESQSSMQGCVRRAMRTRG